MLGIRFENNLCRIVLDLNNTKNIEHELLETKKKRSNLLKEN